MAPSKHAIFTIYKSLSGGGVCRSPLERLETSLLQGSNCARIVPNSAVKFFSSDLGSRGNVVSKPLGQDDNNNSEPSVDMRLDAIRPRMQVVGWNNASSTATDDERSKVPVEYSGMVDTFRKGLIPNSAKMVPS